jgi:hypothetical protein
LARIDKQKLKNPLHWIMLSKCKIDFPSICEQYNATCSFALFTNGSFVLFFLQAKKAKKMESGRKVLIFFFFSLFFSPASFSHLCVSLYGSSVCVELS